MCLPGYILAEIIGSRAGSSAAFPAATVTLAILPAALPSIRRREKRKGEN